MCYSVLTVPKLLHRAVSQTSQHPSEKVMGLSHRFGRLSGSKGYWDVTSLPTQFLFAGFRAVKDTAICMVALSLCFASECRPGSVGLHFHFGPCTQVLNPYMRSFSEPSHTQLTLIVAQLQAEVSAKIQLYFDEQQGCYGLLNQQDR